MNEENWVETTKMRKNVKKTTKKKTEEQDKDHRIVNAGERERERGMKSSNKRKRWNWQTKIRKSSHWCN